MSDVVRTFAFLALFVALVSIPQVATGGFSGSTSNLGNAFAAGVLGASGDYFLHNDPTPPTGDTASHSVLPLDVNSPAAPTLFNYDTDRDSFPGLLLAKTGAGLGETDPTKHQLWSMPITAPVSLVGIPELHVWSAMKDFDTTKRGVIEAGLYDCDGSGGGCVELATGTLDQAPWSSSSGFVERVVVMSGVNSTLAAGRTLQLKVVVSDPSDDDMWLAYDTTTHTSNITMVPGVVPPGDVTAILDCTGGTTTLNLSWTPGGWEDGFLVELFKPAANKLEASWDFPSPGLTSVSIDITGFGNGRYEVIVSGYDATQTIPALGLTFQKTGGCP